MKKCLVTGADGFIGSHLVETLLEQGHEVKALAQYNSFGSWGWLEDIKDSDNLEIITGDIRDPFFCRKIIKTKRGKNRWLYYRQSDASNNY